MNNRKPREYYESKLVKGNVNKYELNLPEGELNNNSRILVNCKVHGWYETSLATIVQGSMCKKCKVTKTARSQRLSRKDRINRANKVHEHKYDYSLLPPQIKNNKIKVRIICPEHGLFTQRLNDHLSGKGCLACSKNSYDKAYIMLVEDWGMIVGIKYGITKNLKRRHSELQASSKLKLTSVAEFQFDSCENVINAESEIKKNVKPNIGRRSMKDGFTETCRPEMLDYVISVFEKHGGMKI